MPTRLLLAACFASLLGSACCRAETPYWVRIADSETGRGIPLVQLHTLNNVDLWTDSNGVAAIDDPSFEGRDVAFFISSDGYAFDEKLVYGTGTMLHVAAGHHDELKMRRINLAERLYRITGADIYGDSVRVGLKVPIMQPILNGGVTGQDTNIAIPYAGKIFWCWGDTVGNAGRNFAVSCATSSPPAPAGSR